MSFLFGSKGEYGKRSESGDPFVRPVGQLTQWEGDSLQTLQNRPVYVVVSLGLIVIAALYMTGVWDAQNVPCGESPFLIYQRQFIHVTLKHLLANLLVFFILSRIESNIGSYRFAFLLLQISILCVVIEYGLSRFIDLNCAIGFSGVLFGLLVWELMQVNEPLSAPVVFTLLLIIILPSLSNPNASLMGHALGAATGAIVALYYKA